jgi:hypothetical protein
MRDRSREAPASGKGKAARGAGKASGEQWASDKKWPEKLVLAGATWGWMLQGAAYPIDMERAKAGLGRAERDQEVWLLPLLGTSGEHLHTYIRGEHARRVAGQLQLSLG